MGSVCVPFLPTVAKTHLLVLFVKAPVNRWFRFYILHLYLRLTHCRDYLLKKKYAHNAGWMLAELCTWERSRIYAALLLIKAHWCMRTHLLVQHCFYSQSSTQLLVMFSCMLLFVCLQVLNNWTCDVITILNVYCCNRRIGHPDLGTGLSIYEVS
jgi:hypothetical protein